MKAFHFLVVTLATLAVVQFAGRVDAASPLPVHNIEGVAGGAITPMAYLDSPESIRGGGILAKPCISMTYVNMNRKNLDAFSVTENLDGWIELGYAANRLGLGTLPSDIRDATNVDIGRSNVWLHHFNARALLVEENTCLMGLTAPAITAGVHAKVNDGISDINQRLGGALSGIGYSRDYGVDFTLTATKTIRPAFLGRPLLLTAGVRASEAAQLGLLGFGDTYYATFEGSVAYVPFDWLVLAYEFRQKPDPYGQIAGLIGNEDNWHALDAIFVLNDRTAFTAGYGHFGTVANTEENGVWFMQLHYHF
jgi:hypothetical protein